MFKAYNCIVAGLVLGVGATAPAIDAFQGGDATEFASYLADRSGESVVLLDDGNVRDLADNALERNAFSYVSGAIMQIDDGRSYKRVWPPVDDSSTEVMLLEAGYTSRAGEGWMAARPVTLPEELLSDVLGRRPAPVTRTPLASAPPRVVAGQVETESAAAYRLDTLQELDWGKPLEMHPRLQDLRFVVAGPEMPREAFLQAVAAAAFAKVVETEEQIKVVFDGEAYRKAAMHGLMHDAQRIALNVPYTQRQVPLDVRSRLVRNRDEAGFDSLRQLYMLPSLTRLDPDQIVPPSPMEERPLLGRTVLEYWRALALGYSQMEGAGLEAVLNGERDEEFASLRWIVTRYDPAHEHSQRQSGDMGLMMLNDFYIKLILLKMHEGLQERLTDFESEVASRLARIRVEGAVEFHLADVANLWVTSDGRSRLLMQRVIASSLGGSEVTNVVMENPMHALVDLYAHPLPAGAFASLDRPAPIYAME